MAKRKRLSPLGDFTSDIDFPAAGPRPVLSGAIGGSLAPIARVAADAATTAALDAVSDELRRARSEGRLIQALPLDAVSEDYLVRDRITVEAEDMGALMESLRARGQQTPIEVVDLGQGRYGLISGWRRLAALRRLLAETGEPRFSTVLALLRQPVEASEAYVAMVEENEVRVGLSYYERARIVARAVDQGVFATKKQALQTLFASASRAKRSKIGSFLAIVAELDSVLRFPAQIGERAGLGLAQALESDANLGSRIIHALRESPPTTPAAEQAMIMRAMRRHSSGSGNDASSGQEVAPGVWLEVSGRRVALSGPGVDADFRARLVAWLVEGGG